jgi:hypothetical protein
VNFFSSIFRIPFIFEDYLDGALILLKHSIMLSFSSLLSSAVHFLSFLDVGHLALPYVAIPAVLVVYLKDIYAP